MDAVDIAGAASFRGDDEGTVRDRHGGRRHRPALLLDVLRRVFRALPDADRRDPVLSAAMDGEVIRCHGRGWPGWRRKRDSADAAVCQRTTDISRTGCLRGDLLQSEAV